jgi:hypothetical protein
MFRLSRGWKLIGIIVLSILVLVTALSCAGPVGPAGKTGPAGPAGPELPVPVVVATPNSLALSGGVAKMSGVNFSGAGWDPAESSVYIEILASNSNNATMLVGAAINAVGAFSDSPSVAAAPLKITAGVYSIRATSKVNGKVAYVPFTIAPEPKK